MMLPPVATELQHSFSISQHGQSCYLFISILKLKLVSELSWIHLDMMNLFARFDPFNMDALDVPSSEQCRKFRTEVNSRKSATGL